MSSPTTRAEPTPAVALLFRLAATQHGVFTTAQARTLEVSRHRLWRLRERGIIEDAGYGAWRVAGSSDTWWQRAHHALLVAGEESALTRTTALGLHLGRDALRRGPIHVVVPYQRSVRFPAHVRPHRSRTHDAEARVDRFGLQTTDVARALIEAGIDRADRWWADLVASALRAQLTSFLELAEELERAGAVPNAKLMRAHLGRLDPAVIQASRSHPEVTLYDALIVAGVPRPILNFEVVVHDRLIAELDLAWPDLCFGAEVDSETFHGLPLAQTRDALRDSRMFDLGWSMRRIPVSMIRDNIHTAVAIVERGLAQARRQLEATGRATASER